MAYAMPVQTTPSATRLNQACGGTCADGHCQAANGASSTAPQASVAAATAGAGKSEKWRLTRFADTPYRNAPMVPAATAGPMAAPSTSPPASTNTPTNPIANPVNRRPPIFSPNSASAASAAKGTAMLLTIALTPAGARSAAHANNRNGSSVLTRPIAAILNQPAAASCRRACHRTGDTGPNFGVAILRNRNEPPQIAASNNSSIGVRQSRPRGPLLRARRPPRRRGGGDSSRASKRAVSMLATCPYRNSMPPDSLANSLNM